MKLNNKVKELLNMDYDRAIDWLIENQSNIVLTTIEDINALVAHEVKQRLFSVGGEINKDSRINSKSQSIAVAHILNEISDLNNDFDLLEDEQ